MKFLNCIKKSPYLGLTISVGLHIFLILGIGFGIEQRTSDLTHGQSPVKNSISLGSFSQQSKSFKKKYSTRPQSASSLSEQTISTLETSTTAIQNNSGSSDGRTIGETKISAKKNYFQDFRNLIELKRHYPLIARKRNLEGVVTVMVTIKNNGEVINHKLVNSSGHNVLDEAAINIIKGITMFRSFPSELNENSIDFKLPLTFRLNN